MVERSLDADTLRRIRAFEQVTDVQPVDCVENSKRIVFVVDADEVGPAVGKNGRKVKQLRDRLDKHVQVVGFSDDPGTFCENYFHDVDVQGVRVEEEGDRTVAYVEVPPSEKPRAIGRKGSNVRLATELTTRHHGVEVVVE